MINEIFRAEEASAKLLSDIGYTRVRRDRMEISLDEFNMKSESYPPEFEVLPITNTTYQEYSDIS